MLSYHGFTNIESNSQQQALPSCQQIGVPKLLSFTLYGASSFKLFGVIIFPDFFEVQNKSEFHMATSEVSGLDELLVNKL